MPGRVVDRAITHGNEADPWNPRDHEAPEGGARRAPRQVFDARGWIPNAGAKLVIDVMNKIKETYPVIDLLKPRPGRPCARSRFSRRETSGLSSRRCPLSPMPRWPTRALVVLGPGQQVIAGAPPVVRLLGDLAPDDAVR